MDQPCPQLETGGHRLETRGHRLETGGHRMETKEVAGWEQKRQIPQQKLPVDKISRGHFF